MASDHPEQNEGDQENTEQNDLQQIEDLKIQVLTYNIHTQVCHNSFDTQPVQWNITWSKFSLPVLTPECDPRRPVAQLHWTLTSRSLHMGVSLY